MKIIVKVLFSIVVILATILFLVGFSFWALFAAFFKAIKVGNFFNLLKKEFQEIGERKVFVGLATAAAIAFMF